MRTTDKLAREEVKMQRPEIIIASRTQAERLLMSKGPGPAIEHIISIGAPGDPIPDGFELCFERLRLAPFRG